jgi:Mn2+/Fe2+ NRAMP family transporter
LALGLAQRPGRAPAFYVTIAAATLVGAALNFTPLDPVKALIWSAIINGVAAVPIMAMIMLMASRRAVMGEFVLTKPLAILGWLAAAVMAAAAVGMFATRELSRLDRPIEYLTSELSFGAGALVVSTLVLSAVRASMWIV